MPSLSTQRTPFIVAKQKRQDFKRWLRKHRRLALSASFPAVVRAHGSGISVAAAYRVAVAVGLRGARRNRTRYARFWTMLNWDLPDGVLSAIWGVAYGNLRQRRVRMGVGAPKFTIRNSASDPTFLDAVRRERRRRSSYTGPRPS